MCPPCQVGCKAVMTFFQYCVLANFFWLLVEGLFLQTLLIFTFANKRTFFWWYTFIGWGRSWKNLKLVNCHVQRSRRVCSKLNSFGTKQFLKYRPIGININIITLRWSLRCCQGRIYVLFYVLVPFGTILIPGIPTVTIMIWTLLKSQYDNWG